MAKTAEEAWKATQKARIQSLYEKFEGAIDRAAERGETSTEFTLGQHEVDLVPQVIEEYKSRGFVVENDGGDISVDWTKK